MEIFLKYFAFLLIAALAVSILAIPSLYLRYKWQNTQGSKMKDKANKFFEGIYSDNVKLSWFILGLAILLLFGVGLSAVKGLSVDDVLEGVFVEMFGMLFDIILLVLLFNWISAKGEKKRKIERYLEEIDDLRHWKAEEAKFRIRGNIIRLNKEGVTEIDLSFISLNGVDLKEVKLDGSNLVETDFANSNMANAELIGIKASSAKFNEKKCYLLNAKINHSHLQHSEFIKSYLNGADFSDATLSSINFSGADLTNTIFKGTYLYDPIFEGAEVNKDFLEKLKNWKITGNFDPDSYTVVEMPVRGLYLPPIFEPVA